MSLNGVSSYSYNPYAYNNAYPTNATSFQGYNTTSATSTSEKEGSALGTIATIGAGIAAVGTAIYAVKKGKKVNGGNGSLWKNLKTGFSEIGKTISKNIGKIFKKNKGAGVENELKQAAEKIENVNRVPCATEALDNAINNYKNIVINKGNEILQEATDRYGRIEIPQTLNYTYKN